MKNENNFLTKEFYSIFEDGTIINEDLNIYTKEKYKNIFEMRKVKNDYLQNVIKLKVKNYICINYEDLLTKYDEILDMIKIKFNLSPKYETYKKIDTYKGITNIKFIKINTKYLNKKKFNKYYKKYLNN
jgi:hypothetical protein